MLCQGQSPFSCPSLCQAPAKPSVPMSPSHHPTTHPKGKTCWIQLRRLKAATHPPSTTKQNKSSSLGGGGGEILKVTPKKMLLLLHLSIWRPSYPELSPPSFCLLGCGIEIPVTTTQAGKTSKCQRKALGMTMPPLVSTALVSPCAPVLPPLSFWGPPPPRWQLDFTVFCLFISSNSI